MKKKWLMFLLLTIVGCVTLYADDDEKDEKATALYVSPAVLIESNSVLPGANLVIETFGKRDSTVVTIGYFHGSESYIESLELAETLMLPNSTKPKDSSAFIIPVSYGYPLTPVRAKNWRVQINSAFRGKLIIANASYESASDSSEDMKSEIFKFGFDFNLGLGMYHSFDNNVNIRYGVDVGIPMFGFQTVDVTNASGFYTSDTELSIEHSGVTSFLDGGINIMPYIAVGISF